MSTGGDGDGSGDDSLGDGRKGGKRELSQSKRAAQNRAAQVRRIIVRVVMGNINVFEFAMGFFLKSGAPSLNWSSCFVNSHVIHPTTQKLT